MSNVLDAASDQLILSLQIRAVFNGFGRFERPLVGVSLGPYEINMEDADLPNGAWSMEVISTQHLAITLDTYLEKNIPNRLNAGQYLDYCCFVRCLRNAFAHDPYNPIWELRDEKYRRHYSMDEDWNIDLTDRNGTKVLSDDYCYASGLLELARRGKIYVQNMKSA